MLKESATAKKPSTTKHKVKREDSGRNGVRHTQGKRKRRNRYPHGVIGKTCLCKQHGLQAVTGCFKDADGYIFRLGCGCHRRKNIEAKRPVRCRRH